MTMTVNRNGCVQRADMAARKVELSIRMATTNPSTFVYAAPRHLQAQKLSGTASPVLPRHGPKPFTSSSPSRCTRPSSLS